MTIKFYTTAIVTAMSDVDLGNLDDWTYAIENNKKVLKTYKKKDWDNIIYVPKAGGTTIVNSYNVQMYGANYAPFYNNFNINRVDLQKVPFKDNSMWFSFSNCSNLTAVYNISPSVQNMTLTFHGCYKLNHNIVLPTNLEYMNSAFTNCTNFNQNIKIPDKLISMDSAFKGCTNFNQNIPIANPRWVRYAFSGCTNFNQNIQFHEGTRDFESTFYNCPNFNQKIKFPNSSTWLPSTFSGCIKFNQSIQIPKDVTNMGYTFSNCRELSERIDILGTEVFNVTKCFNNTSKAKAVYIHYQYANGTYTKTYNTCFGSSGIAGAYGVTMHDLGRSSW